jgi:hypothetical protein
LGNLLSVQNGYAFSSRKLITKLADRMPLVRIRDLKNGDFGVKPLIIGRLRFPMYEVRRGDHRLIGMDGEFACHRVRVRPLFTNRAEVLPAQQDHSQTGCIRPAAA